MRRQIPCFLVLFLLALPTMACVLPGRGVIVVTATPSAIPITPSVTPIPATATPTLTPTPMPTPTTAPNVAIAQANTALHNGDYDSAVTIYRSILDRPMLSVDPRLRADASIGLGTAALREGKFDDAVTALSDFIQTYSSDPRLPQAYFLRGDAYMGLEQWANAITNFQVYAQKRPGLIDSYVYERIGDANLALKNPDQALANYNQAVAATRGLVPMLALREKVAASYLNANNVNAAIAQYDAILAAAKDPAYRAGIAYTAADVLSRTGNKTAALARYQAIIGSYPRTLVGYRSMLALLRAGVQVDDLLRAQISLAAEDYKDVITALYNYTSKTALTDIDPAVFLWLGQAYREVGNTSAANTSFQTIIDQYPKSTLYGEAWLEQGRTLYLAGKVQESIAKYKELVDKHPDTPQAAEALWRAGYLYSTLGDTESSLATFEILGNQYKGTDWAMDGLFRGGMAAYNQNAYGRAQRFFALLATSGTGNLRAAGALWLGRLYQLDNQPQLARDAYTEAAKADPGGYYSVRAADLLAGHGPFVPPPKIDLTFNDPTHLAEADNWLRKTFKVTQTGDLSQLPPTLASDPRMIRGTELWSLVANNEAIGEFDSLTQDNESNPAALYQLATYYYKIGLYRQAIETTAKLLDGAKIQTADAPKAIAALRFPIAYYDLVLSASQTYNVDPLLVFSVIRQESLFQGAATSYAAAQGLMQIIPSTGEYIARSLNWPDYQNSDIYRPYVNVNFGVFYLHEQLETFDGNVYAALAAYNAGPGYSSEWYRISNGDPDLFLQAISIDQTQTYVRRIYEQYATYTAIYGAQ
jgi:peptidoglycan lytic transglycosylase